MGQKIGIDAQAVIYFLEDNKEYADRVERIFIEVAHGRLEAVFSSVGLIEILTGPKKQGRYDLAAEYRDALTHFPNLTIKGINERIIEVASDLRARYNIGTPDAIHVATAIDFGAKKFITNDQNLHKVKDITIEVL